MMLGSSHASNALITAGLVEAVNVASKYWWQLCPFTLPAWLISAHSCLVDSVFEVGDALFVAFSDAPKITKATMTAIANRHLPERRGGRCSWVGGVVVTP
jgi:hypothetical protein